MTFVVPCLICGVPVRNSSRCSAHKRPDRRPSTKRRGSRSLSTRMRRQALYRDGWTCRTCGLMDRSGKLLEADHIVRLADGGAHDLENLQILCRSCHGEKSRLERKGSPSD